MDSQKATVEITIPREIKKLKGKKVLCVCAQGVSRSGGLQWFLKNFYQIDALPVGVQANSPETIEMLFKWADVIINTTHEINTDQVPEEYKKKIILWDVGQDRYFMGYHSDLIEQYAKYLEEYEK